MNFKNPFAKPKPKRKFDPEAAMRAQARTKAYHAAQRKQEREMTGDEYEKVYGTMGPLASDLEAAKRKKKKKNSFFGGLF
jgi:hypothetical protein